MIPLSDNDSNPTYLGVKSNAHKLNMNNSLQFSFNESFNRLQGYFLAFSVDLGLFFIFTEKIIEL